MANQKLKPMTKEEYKLVTKTANAMLFLQLAYDNLQFLPETNLYKQRNKQKIDMMLSFLEKETNNATSNMLTNDFKNLNDVCDKVRALINEFEISAEKYLDEINRKIESGEF